MSSELPQKYLEGIRLFNAEEFFECHDVLEELWTEVIDGERKFYQGLIQAAVALFHFGNENLGGAMKLYRSSREKLEMYRPHFMEMDLDRFLTDFELCFRELLDARPSYPAHVLLKAELLPRIELAGTALDEGIANR